MPPPSTAEVVTVDEGPDRPDAGRPQRGDDVVGRAGARTVFRFWLAKPAFHRLGRSCRSCVGWQAGALAVCRRWHCFPARFELQHAFTLARAAWSRRTVERERERVHDGAALAAPASHRGRIAARRAATLAVVDDAASSPASSSPERHASCRAHRPKHPARCHGGASSLPKTGNWSRCTTDRRAGPSRHC